MNAHSGHLVSLHSFRGGTGKSNISANIAYLLAESGKRVAVLDTDLQSPGVHVVLGLDQKRVVHTLSDFCLGDCHIEDAAYDLTETIGIQNEGGRLFLLPSSMRLEKISKLISDGYDADRLNQKMRQLIETLELDFLIIDTHPGLNRETMMTLAIADEVIFLIRPDAQDYHGSAVLIEVAKRLHIPQMRMLANKVTEADQSRLADQLTENFGLDVLGVLPLSEDLTRLGSRGIFAKTTPNHPFSRELIRIARSLCRPESPTESGVSQ